MARSALAPLYDTRRDDDEIRTEALQLLTAMASGIDDYFFVFDASGRNLLHPRQPELQGPGPGDLQDPQGVHVIRELIARAHEGGGYVRYLWEKPSARTLKPKLAYAISLPRWNMMIGTGVYLDDIQATLARLDAQVDENVTTTMLWIAAIAVLGIVLIGGCGLVLNLGDHARGRCQTAQPRAPGGEVAGGRARPPLARAARQHQPDAGVDRCCSNPPSPSWAARPRRRRCSARCSASATRCTRCGASRTGCARPSSTRWACRPRSTTGRGVRPAWPCARALQLWGEAPTLPTRSIPRCSASCRNR